MITVKDILTFLNQIAPNYMQEEWDNNGLLCGREDKKVRTVLIALDPFRNVCDEAIEMGADMILTHHPLIFQPLSAVTDESILRLIEHNIAAVNAHTNLDCAPGGVNDTLAAKLGLKDIEVVSPRGEDETGKPWGLLRKGTVTPQSLQDFLSYTKAQLGCQTLRYVQGTETVCHIAVSGGSCGDCLYEAKAAGCDTFVTADVKYNQFWTARELGMNLIDATHFATENPICAVLAEKLREAFPEITVILSKNHADCMKFF